MNPQKVLEIRIAELEAQNAKLASAPAAPTFAPAFPPPPPVIPAAAAPQVAVPFHKLVRSVGNKYLSKSFPASFKVRELNAWIKKATPNMDSKTLQDDIANEANTEFENKDQDGKTKALEYLRSVAVEWGMPFGKAGEADVKTIIRILALAAAVN